MTFSADRGPVMAGGIAVSPRLGRFLRPARERAPAPGECCELCASPIALGHRHLLELEPNRLRCVCSPCALLFERPGAGAGRYRAVPDRVLRLEGFELDESRWYDLAIPVGLAYFVRSSRESRVRAFYPAPMGAVESKLGLDAWSAIERDNPVLAAIEQDVEALLVRRLPSGEDFWVVSIEACFELVAILRTRWRGLTGGEQLWSEVETFFVALEAKARQVDREGRRIPCAKTSITANASSSKEDVRS